MGLTMTQNQYIVLRAYHEMAGDDEYLNNTELAKKMKVGVNALRSVIEECKTEGWLEGERKIAMTPAGTEAFREATDLLQQKSMAQKEPAAVDPSAAVTRPAVHTAPPPPHQDDPVKLSEIVARNFNVDPQKLWNVVKQNVMGGDVTDEEVMQVMSVMHKYQLDPFVKQVYAFRHRNKLQIHVAIDGWIAIANRNPDFQGVEYEFPDEMVDAPQGGRKCWPWVKAICHVRGRKPTVVYAFMEEWFVGNSDNWKDRPAYRLQKKAYTMAIREGLGIALYDDVDRDQFVAEGYKVLSKTQSTEDLLTEIDAKAFLDEPREVPSVEAEEDDE